MAKIVDYTKLITLCQGGCNANFILCDYRGKERTFFAITQGQTTNISVVTAIRPTNSGNGLVLKLPSFSANEYEYLVPGYLSYYKMSEQELIQLNRGRAIYGV